MDAALAQLDHRRRTLPEHAALAALRAEQAAVGSDLVAADTAVSDLEREQGRAEADLDPVRERLARNQKRVADGSVADPKALSSLVEEIAHLQKRIRYLEDAELEVMERLEVAEATRSSLRGRAARLEADVAVAESALTGQLAQLEAEAATRRTERQELAPLVPADLTALYDKLRAGHAGVGAAELRARRCTGCQLEVNAADLRVFAAAAADEVIRCEECGRILVRTERSGI